MNRISPFALFVVALIVSLPCQSQAQSTDTDKAVRPRSVAAVAAQQTATPAKQAEVAQPQTPSSSPAPSGTTQPAIATSLPYASPAAQAAPAKADAPSAATPSMPTSPAKEAAERPNQGATVFLTPSVVQARISEAQRLLKSRPVTTALTSTQIDFVTIAALDRETSKTHLVTISKKTFLTKGSEITLPSSYGVPLTIRVVRANGVNTALTVFTQDGKSLAPLTIEYPIERNGRFLETAYYTSAHPSLLSKDLFRSGQSYVRNMLDLAVKRLQDKGVAISPVIVA